MRIPRVFVDQPLEVGTTTELPSGAAAHLSKVLRMRPGQKAILFNGRDGKDYAAKLTLVTKRSVSAQIAFSGPAETETALSIHLAIGISKGARMDYAIQKSVELGVSTVTPLFTSRVNTRMNSERIERKMHHWLGVIINACEQSGRRRLPRLNQPTELSSWLNQSNGQTLLLDHESSSNLQDLATPDSDITLLIGPEGGLSKEEKQAAFESGCKGIRLGPRVMRTETAPVAAIAAIQALWGDFRE